MESNAGDEPARWWTKSMKKQKYLNTLIALVVLAATWGAFTYYDKHKGAEKPPSTTTNQEKIFSSRCAAHSVHHLQTSRRGCFYLPPRGREVDHYRPSPTRCGPRQFFRRPEQLDHRHRRMMLLTRTPPASRNLALTLPASRWTSPPTPSRNPSRCCWATTRPPVAECMRRSAATRESLPWRVI